ncbi:unnamed protein product, partial [Ectocarpus sp. 13 AM-2016]
MPTEANFPVCVPTNKPSTYEAHASESQRESLIFVGIRFVGGLIHFRPQGLGLNHAGLGFTRLSDHRFLPTHDAWRFIALVAADPLLVRSTRSVCLRLMVLLWSPSLSTRIGPST